MKCPSCQAHTFENHFPAIVFVCPVCELVFALVHGKWQEIEGVPMEPVHRSPIALGAHGTIAGIDYTVLGVAVRFYWMSPDDREPYFEPYRVFRYEHVVESADGNAHVLTWDNGQWWLASFVDPANVIMQGYRHQEFEGRLYVYRSFISSTLSYAVGFFPYPITRSLGHFNISDYVAAERVLTVRTDPKLATGEPHPNAYTQWPGFTPNHNVTLEGVPCGADDVALAFGLDQKQWKSVTWPPMPATKPEVLHKPLQQWQKWIACVLIVAALSLLPLLRKPPSRVVAETTIACPALFARNLPRETKTVPFETTIDHGVIRFEMEMKQGSVTFHLLLSGAGSARESLFIDQKDEFVAGRQPSKRRDWKPGLFPAGRHLLEIRCEAVAILQSQQPVRIQVLDGSVPRPAWAGLVSALLLSTAMGLLFWRERME